MSFTVLKPFQSRVVENITAIFTKTLDLMAQLKADSLYPENRRRIQAEIGSILLEAPTGIGKTLMAGQAVGRICENRKMLWFWFAPFSSVVIQTAGVLREEVPSLRLRDLTQDRDPQSLTPGDIFLTTWSSVAVNNEVSRKAKDETENLPSLEKFLDFARLQGYKIGAVVDEAHHSFRGSTQAFSFFQTILDPDVTLLVTATPRDGDIETFCRTVHLGRLKRVTVSRAEGVEAGLLKHGVKTAMFTVANRDKDLVDFKKTALIQGLQVHNRIKSTLKASGSTVIPLLLLQVDSTPGSVEEAQKWLKEMGYGEDKVMVHTAEQPDPSLNAVQGAEEIEILVFKMAVAMGFDAPRAFTLVSFRSARDADFGVQIVGRLMRVDRRLQTAENLPLELKYGFVFLSEAEAQTGILTAGERINSIRTELASLGARVDVVMVDKDTPGVVKPDPYGQLPIFGETAADALQIGPLASSQKSLAEQGGLWDQWNLPPQTPNAAKGVDKLPRVNKPDVPLRGEKLVSLRTDISFPRRFIKAQIDVLQHDVLNEVVNEFRWDTDVLASVNKASTKILMQEWEVFSGEKDSPTEIQARLLQKEIKNRANHSLISADSEGHLDPRTLYQALVNRLKREWDLQGWDNPGTSQFFEESMDKILALNPQLLPQAVSKTLAKYTVAVEAADLEETIVVPEGIRMSRLGLYKVFPQDLNRWELAFAELLDNDLTGTVLWWHRNPVRKPCSVVIPVPGQPAFFPDFLVGVKGRKTKDQVRMVEIKGQINDPSGNAAAKSQVKHPEYGHALMLHWRDERDWMTVEFNPSQGQNRLDRIFQVDLL